MSDNKFTYSTEQIAEVFGTTQLNIRQHKSRHKAELLKNIHFISVTGVTGYQIFWSKEGVIMLSDWIGTKEAKKFIGTLEVRKEDQNKGVTTLTPVPNTLDNLPDSQVFGLMELMLVTIKKQAEKQHQLELKVEQLESTSGNQNIIQVKTAKDFKTLKTEKKTEVGAEINSLIRTKFIIPYHSQEDLKNRTQFEIIEIYKQANREARKVYWDHMHETYVGAKHATYESKVKFLNWLKQLEI